MESNQINPLIKKAIDHVGNQTKLAQKINVSQPTVNRWLNMKFQINAISARKIEEVTEGAVTKEQLLPLVFGQIQPTSEPTTPQ